MNDPPAITPKASRPGLPQGYGMPKSKKGMLPWSFVDEQMTAAPNFWVATTDARGRVHAVPLWGVWVDDTCYFGGSSETRWARNLSANPRVCVHLESTTDPVMLEGAAHRVGDDADPALLSRIDDAYEAKYDMRHGPPFWALRPSVVYAWAPFPTAATKWTFDEVKEA
jgi:hypothetical protein